MCFNIGQDKFSREANNVTAHDVTFLDTAAKQSFQFYPTPGEKGSGKKAVLDATKPPCNAVPRARISPSPPRQFGPGMGVTILRDSFARDTHLESQTTQTTRYNGWSEGETFIRHLPRRAKLCASPTARERRLIVNGSRPGLAARGHSVRFTRWGFP